MTAVNYIQESLALCQQKSYSDRKKLSKVKDCIEKDVYELATHFKEFHIGEENYRYRAASSIVTNNGRLISSAIQNFDLSKPHIKKIATRALKQDPSGTLEHFANFGLSEEDSFPLGLKAASEQPAQTAKQFVKLGIVQPDKVFAIARTAFLQDARGCSKYIDNFHLQDEAQRFELLMIRLEADADKALDLVKKFKIVDSQYRFKAALMAAKYDGWSFSAQIPEWHFEDMQKRFELFKTAFTNDSGGAVRNLDNFDLKGPLLLEALDLASKITL